MAMNMDSALAQVSEKDRQIMIRLIEDAQMNESLQIYNGLVEKCFGSCVTSFRGKQLDSSEDKCIKKCAEKFIKANRRMSQRFVEITGQMSANN